MSANGLHRIRWRRVAVARIDRTAASPDYGESVRERLSKRYTARIHRTVASQLALETGRSDKS